MPRSVRLSVCPIPLAQKRCILGLWLLCSTNKNPVLEVPTGQRGHKSVTGAASEAFVRWLHHRYAPIVLPSSGAYGFAREILMMMPS